MESLAILVAAIILSQMAMAVLAFGVSFTNFKYLSLTLGILSIVIGCFMLFATPQIALPVVDVLSGLFAIIKFFKSARKQ